MTRVAAVGLAVLLLVWAPAMSAGAERRIDRAPSILTLAPQPAPPGSTALLSKARDGGGANGASIGPAMSANGRFVVFASVASNLVANDEPGSVEVFLLDRRSGKISRAPLPNGFSRSAQATQTEPAVSADGRIVAYTYEPAFTAGIVAAPTGTFVVAWDRNTGKVSIVSRNRAGQPQRGAREASVSGDGRYIAYTTTYELWDAGGDDGQDDVVRFDRQTGRTVLVSVGFSGGRIEGDANGPSISADGSLVAFESDGGDSVVAEDTGSGVQVYLRDLARQVTERISAPPDGTAASGPSTGAAISGDGRYVAFASQATNLTAEAAPGLFRRDRVAGTTIMVSVAPDGTPGKGASVQPAITADGGMVAWASTATNLVPETSLPAPAAVSRAKSEVFVRDIDAGETVLVSVSLDDTGGGGQNFQPAIAAGGRFIAFASDSANLVRGDRNEAYDVFLRDLPPVPVVNPAVLELGSGAVGTTSLPLAATLGNAGWSPLSVTGASLSGAGRADFQIVADGCAGRQLRRSEACTVSVTFTPHAAGARTATLGIADAYQGSPRTVRLRGRASLASLVLDPPIGQPGIVTIAEGSGFPPGASLRLSWSIGITPKLPIVVADGEGRFRVPVLVFHSDRTGPRELQVTPVDAGAFPPLGASMLVTTPSAVPLRFDIIRLIDVPLMLVFRG